MNDISFIKKVYKYTHLFFSLFRVKDMREGERRLDAFIITPEGKI